LGSLVYLGFGGVILKATLLSRNYRHIGAIPRSSSIFDSFMA
jgi:hypothetical protein